MTWKDCVEFGKEWWRARRLSDWELADMLVIVSETKPDHGENNNRRDLSYRFGLFKKDTGIELGISTLRNKYSTAVAWPKKSRQESVCFAAHTALNAHPQRKRIIKGKNMSLERAQKMMSAYTEERRQKTQTEDRAAARKMKQQLHGSASLIGSAETNLFLATLGKEDIDDAWAEVQKIESALDNFKSALADQQDG